MLEYVSMNRAMLAGFLIAILGASAPQLVTASSEPPRLQANSPSVQPSRATFALGRGRNPYASLFKQFAFDSTVKRPLPVKPLMGRARVNIGVQQPPRIVCGMTLIPADPTLDVGIRVHCFCEHALPCLGCLRACSSEAFPVPQFDLNGLFGGALFPVSVLDRVVELTRKP
jgi:hypothetical protein